MATPEKTIKLTETLSKREIENRIGPIKVIKNKSTSFLSGAFAAEIWELFVDGQEYKATRLKKVLKAACSLRGFTVTTYTLCFAAEYKRLKGYLEDIENNDADGIQVTTTYELQNYGTSSGYVWVATGTPKLSYY